MTAKELQRIFDSINLSELTDSEFDKIYAVVRNYHYELRQVRDYTYYKTSRSKIFFRRIKSLFKRK